MSNAAENATSIKRQRKGTTIPTTDKKNAGSDKVTKRTRRTSINDKKAELTNHKGKFFTLGTIPQAAGKHLIASHYCQSSDVVSRNTMAEMTTGLFAAFEEEVDDSADIVVTHGTVTWGIDTYASLGDGYQPTDHITDLSIIRQRFAKTKDEQRARSKTKGEVFTPTWVVNLQNDSVDDLLTVGDGFTTEKGGSGQWEGTESPIVFVDGYSWQEYVNSPRIEITCGEAPYLFCQYNSVTGEYIPVRDTSGRFQRPGLLDRKLRVVSENATSFDDWRSLAERALRSTFGYEWSGDSLVIARLNMVNTYLDFMVDYCGVKGVTVPGSEDFRSITVEVAEIASWQLFQLDGLWNVVPLSCSATCNECKRSKLLPVSSDHVGDVPVVRWVDSQKVLWTEIGDDAKS